MIEASQKILGESFTEDVSQRVDIAAPEVEIEVKTKEEKVPRSLRKKLNIEKGSDLYNKVKDAVVKTFGTKLPEVTDPKFKKALSDSYKRELKKEINALMGTRSDFKMFVTNNAETLYKSIPQETINKRFQTFSEPVLDKEGRQVREKTAVGKGVFKKKPFNKEEFINYFLGEDVGASTKGTRKTALSETIADEMALDATMEVIEDPKVFEKFKEIQEIEGKEVPKDIKPKISEKVKRPEGFKFNKAVKNIEDLTVKVNPEFEGEIKNIDQLLSTYINDKTYKHDSKTSIDDFFTDVEKVWVPNLPKDLITKTVLRPSNRILAKKGKIKIKVDGIETTTDEYFVNKRDNFLKNKKIKYGKPFTGKAKDYKYGITYSKYFGSTPGEISKTNEKGKTRGKGENKITQNIKQINAMHLSMHKQLWERVFKYIRENNKNAKAWGNYFSLVGVDVTHPHRMGAEMLGWSKNPIGYEGKLYEWEHAMPATRAYLYLLIASLDKNFTKSDFETMYDLVIKNFKLIALDNYDDKVKIKGAGRTTSMGKGWSIVTDSWFNRYFDEIIGKIQGGIDPSSIQGLNNKTFTEELGIDSNGNLTNNNIQKLKKFSKSVNIKDLSNNVVKFNKNITNEVIIGYAKTIDEALKVSRYPNAPVKKIRVFDFDYTLATTKSDVLFTTPNGTEGKLNAEEFAKQGKDLLDEGYVFDFSEFNKVTKGKPGPLLDIAKKIQAARGTEDVFVLTARAPEAQVAIKEFLDSVGLNIPLENITGLGNSTGEAKANWMVEKAAEGYNDFYFAYDAYQNVKAVKNAMSVLDVKSKVQQAKIKFSKSVNEDFNKIIEQTAGIAS